MKKDWSRAGADTRKGGGVFWEPPPSPQTNEGTIFKVATGQGKVMKNCVLQGQKTVRQFMKLSGKIANFGKCQGKMKFQDHKHKLILNI